MADSEVMCLLRQIEMEYEAAQRGLTGVASVASHQFITARVERIARCHLALVQRVGAQEATRLLDEISVNEQGKRPDV